MAEAAAAAAAAVRPGRPGVGTLVYVGMVHRHGARGPAVGEMAPFQQCAVREEWREEDMELATEVGEQQMHLLGDWFVDCYVRGSGEGDSDGDGGAAGSGAVGAGSDAVGAGMGRRRQLRVPSDMLKNSSVRQLQEQQKQEGKEEATAAADTASESVKWRASTSSRRAVQSGTSCTAAMAASLARIDGEGGTGGGIFRSEPLPYADDVPGESANDYFRAWNVDEFYKGLMRQRSTSSEVWQKKSEEEREVLEILRRMFLRPPSQASAAAEAEDGKAGNDEGQAGDEVPAEGDTAVVVDDMLWQCTYVWAMLEVEKNWPSETQGQRDALIRILVDDAHVVEVERLARWVWAQRFMHSGEGPRIGGKLSGELLGDVRAVLREREQEPPRQDGTSGDSSLPPLAVGVYSGHDYSILAIITALQLQEDYGSPPLGFSSYLLFELFDRGTSSDADEPDLGRFTLRVLLNHSPFRDNDTWAPENTRVCTENTVLLAQWGNVDDAFLRDKMRMCIHPDTKDNDTDAY